MRFELLPALTMLLTLSVSEAKLSLADESSPPGGGDSRIVFQSERDGNMEIYVMAADGTGQTRLTDHPSTDTYPAWSPGGDEIAFVSDRDGNDEIYLMNTDGTGLERLSTEPTADSAPRWTADGKRIVFTSSRQKERASFIMNEDGTGVRRI